MRRCRGTGPASHAGRPHTRRPCRPTLDETRSLREKMRSSQEELQSASEELQSTNE